MANEDPKSASSVLADRIAADESLDRLPDLAAMMSATPQVRRIYYSEAVRQLGARRFFFDKAAGCMVFEPDGVTRMKAVAWLGGYDAGMPIQRILQAGITNNGFTNIEEMKKAIATSPAMLAGLKRMIDEIEVVADAKKPDQKKVGPESEKG